MHPERWRNCIDIFQAAVERPPEERAAFLDLACAGDDVLRRKVELLLKYNEKTGNFIETPAFEVSPELLLDDPDVLIGKHLGHYRIDSVLGAGGMGVVYLACDEELGRKVGLKLLPPSLVADEAHLERLKREARTASALNHPNIVTIHEIGQVDATHYIATEFIDGTTLRERMSQGSVSPNEALEIARQVASALSVAHAAGIVHRDIKPENIMLRPDGYVKVLDFGIAKFAQHDALGLEAGTQPGMILGTTRYMSPEQARGQEVDARTDIWSLGVVLYEMLAGCPPFEGETPADVTSAVLMRAAPSLAAHTPNLPAKLQSIVEKSLRKEKGERYQSAGELLNDLRGVKDAVVGEEKITTPTTRPLARKSGRSYKKIVVLGLAMILAVGGIVYFILTETKISAIAVLPFENATGEPDAEYIVDGITDSLINNLSKVRQLRVIPRSTVFRDKGRPTNATAVGRELNVDAVLTGSVARSSERVRITVQLIRTATGRKLWTESYERDLREVLALEREVARNVAGELGLKLTPQEQAQFAEARPVNPEAYDHYLRGRYHLHRQTRDDNEAAITALERAVATDQTFAAAYAELAQAYVWQLFLFAPGEELWAEKAFVAAEKALSLDPNLAEAYLARGRSLWTPANHFPHEKAIREYRRALTLDPNLDEARNQLALVYCHIGAFDEALQESYKAVRANPNNNLAQFRIGQTLNFQGKYEQALSVLLALPREANPALVGDQIAWALFNLGRKEEASALIDQLLKDHPEDSGGLFASVQAVLAASAGQEDMAEEKIQLAVDRGKGFGHFHHSAYHIACAYALMHKPEQAIKWLVEAAEDGFPCYPLFERDPNLDNLRQDPRFITFLSKLKQKWESYRTIL
jgi:serine/threonine protein kinase/tetratricopeptide (TPR) repeat protein